MAGALEAVNTADKPNVVTPQARDWQHQLKAGHTTYSFPPHSFSVLRFAGSLGPAAADEWRPAQVPLMTRWGKAVSPAGVLPEYPRPQMTRSAWLNLNGLWDYAVTAQGRTFTADLPGQDPRALSDRVGPVGRTQGLRREQPPLVPAKLRRLPETWGGSRILLHFGAVDWEAAVAVNGRPVGTHRGGYDAVQLRHYRRFDRRRTAGADGLGPRRDRRRPGQGQAGRRQPGSPRHAGLFGRVGHLADRMARAGAADEHRQAPGDARRGSRCRPPDGEHPRPASGCPGRRRFTRGRRPGRRPGSGAGRRAGRQRADPGNSAAQTLVAGPPVSLRFDRDAAAGRAAGRFGRELLRHAEDRPGQRSRRGRSACC